MAISTSPATIPYRLLTDPGMRPVRHMILITAITVIALSQNMSYYGQVAPPSGTESTG
ncbi:MAG: hypothetical protein LUE10_02610 [Alistipes sp.]|nr:hypothetical protein [Alistipes sp.]